MGWIQRFFAQRAGEKRRLEMAGFISTLTQMNAGDLGSLIALATDRRHYLATTFGWALLNPTVALQRDPNIVRRLKSLIGSAAKEGDQLLVMALRVWFHTVRSAEHPSLSNLAVDMWSQLQRGFGHVLGTDGSGPRVLDRTLRVDEFDQIPSSLNWNLPS